MGGFLYEREAHIQMTTGPLVSIIMVNYNGRQDLEQGLPSLFSQTYVKFEVIVVDNGSTDDSISFLTTHYSCIQVIPTGKNLGFGAGNNVGIAASKGDLVVFTNYDVEFDPEWLKKLVDAAQSDSLIGIVQPRIMLYGSNPPVETYLVFNYVGHVFSKAIEWEQKNARPASDIEVATGCCFLIKKSVLQRIGSFDEYFHRFSTRFFYSSLEDNDLSWRTQIAGYRILYEPESIIYHKYEQKPLAPLRYYYLECGRLYSMLKNYEWKTLLIILPAFIISEIMGWGYLLINGPEFIKEKLRTMEWLFNSFGLIKIARIRVQIHRRISDATILSRFQADTEIRHVNWPPIVRRAVETPINTFFRGCKSIALSLLQSLDKHSNSTGSL